ncbi:MAG: hypothetical protein RIE56_06685 [Amphiplicatus sp.]
MTFVISHQFRSATNRLENEVTRMSSQLSGPKIVTDNIAHFIAGEFSNVELAGVVRAALKLAPTNPEALTPVTEYRDAANEMIYAAMKTKIKDRDTKQRIEEGLQIIFAVIFDAIQQNHGPLILNNARASAVLARQFQARLSDQSKMPAGPLFNKGKLRGSGKRTQEVAVASAKAADAVIVPGATVKDAPPGKATAKANTNRRRRAKL